MKNPSKGVSSISWDYSVTWKHYYYWSEYSDYSQLSHPNEDIFREVLAFLKAMFYSGRTPWYNSLCPLFRESHYSGSFERFMHKWCWNNQNLNCHEWIVKNYEKYWSIIWTKNQSDLYSPKLNVGNYLRSSKVLYQVAKNNCVPTILSWYQLAISQGSALWLKLLGNKRKKNLFLHSYKVP